MPCCICNIDVLCSTSAKCQKVNIQPCSPYYILATYTQIYLLDLIVFKKEKRTRTLATKCTEKHKIALFSSCQSMVSTPHLNTHHICTEYGKIPSLTSTTDTEQTRFKLQCVHVCRMSVATYYYYFSDRTEWERTYGLKSHRHAKHTVRRGWASQVQTRLCSG